MRKKRINKISRKQELELLKRERLRIKLLEICKGRCMACGKYPDFKDGRGELHLSHTIPTGQGGKTTIENCEVLCRQCHRLRHGGVEK